MFAWLRKLWKTVELDPLPDLHAEPDQTGNALGMDYWISAQGENTELPREGDVIIQIISDGMGASVKQDVRHRVKGAGKYTRSVACETADGKTTLLHVFYMRRHKTLPRTWVLMN